MKRILYTSCLTFISLCIISNADAQRRRSTKKKVTVAKNETKPATSNETRMDAAALADTSSPRVVTITSAFKPSLKNAAKINFTAASTYIDSSRTPVTYSVPAQNLFFSYQPVPIKPLALPADTGYRWQNDHSIRAGLGNFNSFLVTGSFSFGDGVKSNTIVNADYLSNKGDLFAQQYAKLGLSVLSVFNTNNNNEWTTKASYKNTTRYFYGFDNSTLNIKKEDLLQRFNEAGIEIGLRNKKANAFNITYAPKLSLKYFADNRQGKEYNAILEAPLRKSFANKFAIDLGIVADIASTSATVPVAAKVTNNLFYVSPSVQFQSQAFKLNAGIRPSWDNGKFATLPNITAEAKVGETGLLVEAGWVGYFQKNGYRTLTDINPWILQPTVYANTKIGEQYAGIRGAAGNHFTYRARLSFMRMNNQPLFPTTWSIDGKSFDVFYEPEMDVVQLHGEIGYTLQEKLSLLGGVTYRQFTSLQKAQKAWGLLPLEVTGALRWKMFKDLQLKADVFLWDGSHYRNRNQTTLKLDPAADLNIGAEFSVMPKLNLWVQLNNVLNNRYRRWNQYEVLGLNVLGGVVYSFR
ncbi:MAG: hypothetical protein IBJ16_10300 [Chitinophagaceae bacterium]|nr:hypothetical protein [Chitinophagaceae bacterium]